MGLLRLLGVEKNAEPTEVQRGAGDVERAFLTYKAELLAEYGIDDDGPGAYTLQKIGSTAFGTTLWCVYDDGPLYMSVYVLDQPGSGDDLGAEVFVAMSHREDGSDAQLAVAEEHAEAFTADVVKELGADRDAWSAALMQAVERAEQPVEKSDVPDREYRPIAKSGDEQRYTLGVAYPVDEVDSHGDYTDAIELELAAWNFMAKARNAGTDHVDGTDGAGAVVESYVWRGEPWVLDGKTVAKEGDWMLGVIWNEETWDRIKRDELTGYSMQGLARIDDEDTPDADDS